MSLINTLTLPSVTNQQITFTAKRANQQPTITFVNGGTAGSEVATASGLAISVLIEAGVTTTTQAVAAINAATLNNGKLAPADLVSCAIAGGQEATAVTSFVSLALAGGTALNGASGNVGPMLVEADPATPGTSESGASPATTTAVGTMSVDIDADGAQDITLASSATGLLIAADIQAKIRALTANTGSNQASIDAATCVFSGGKYLVTSGSIGASSAVVIVDGAAATAGTSVSDAAPATTTSGGVMSVDVDGDGAQNITVDANVTGAAIAADVQAKIRALTANTPANQASIDAVTCAFTTVYTITSGATGIASSVVIATGAVATELKLGVTDGGTETVGTNGDVATALKLGAGNGGTEATGADNGAGAGGNSITVAFTDGATAGSEVVSVVGTDISVQIEDGVSTLQEVITAINDDGTSGALVTCSSAGLSPEVPMYVAMAPAAAPISLAGGTDAAAATTGAFQNITVVANATGTAANGKTVTLTTGGTAGSEVVTVASGNVSCKIQSGTSTATQVRSALNSAGAFSALYTATGTSSANPVTVNALALTGAVNPSFIGGVLDESAVTLTTSLVYYSLGNKCSSVVVRNTETSGTDTLLFNFDGGANSSALTAGQSVTFNDGNFSGIFLAYVTGSPTFEVIASGAH